MSLPPLPLSAVPIDLPARVSAGDVGVSVQVNLVGGDSGYVYLPDGFAATFSAIEQSPAPRHDRRQPRTIAGSAVVGANAYALSYVLQAADTLSPGIFDMAFVVTWPASAGTSTFPAGTLEIR